MHGKPKWLTSYNTRARGTPTNQQKPRVCRSPAGHGCVTDIICTALTTKVIVAHLEAERVKTGTTEEVGSIGAMLQVLRLREDLYVSCVWPRTGCS